MPRVLLVEDDPDLAAALMRMLSDDDDVVAVHAPDLATATRLLIEHEPDLIVSDNQLPDGLGEQWLPGVKAAHPGIRCVLQSGAYSDRQAARVQAATGLDGVHAKGLRALRAIDEHVAVVRGA